MAHDHPERSIAPSDVQPRSRDPEATAAWLGLPAMSALALHEQIVAGLPAQTFDVLVGHLERSAPTVPWRAILRRIVWVDEAPPTNADAPLSREAGDRVARVARVVALAQRADLLPPGPVWLATPHPQLTEGMAPVDCLGSDAGAAVALELLAQDVAAAAATPLALVLPTIRQLLRDVELAQSQLQPCDEGDRGWPAPLALVTAQDALERAELSVLHGIRFPLAEPPHVPELQHDPDRAAREARAAQRRATWTGGAKTLADDDAGPTADPVLAGIDAALGSIPDFPAHDAIEAAPAPSPVATLERLGHELRALAVECRDDAPVVRHVDNARHDVEAALLLLRGRAGDPPPPRSFGALRGLVSPELVDAVLAPLPEDELRAWEGVADAPLPVGADVAAEEVAAQREALLEVVPCVTGDEAATQLGEPRWRVSEALLAGRLLGVPAYRARRQVARGERLESVLVPTGCIRDGHAVPHLDVVVRVLATAGGDAWWDQLRLLAVPGALGSPLDTRTGLERLWAGDLPGVLRDVLAVDGRGTLDIVPITDAPPPAVVEARRALLRDVPCVPATKVAGLLTVPRGDVARALAARALLAVPADPVQDRLPPDGALEAALVPAGAVRYGRIAPGLDVVLEVTRLAGLTSPWTLLRLLGRPGEIGEPTDGRPALERLWDDDLAQVLRDVLAVAGQEAG